MQHQYESRVLDGILMVSYIIRVMILCSSWISFQFSLTTEWAAEITPAGPHGLLTVGLGKEWVFLECLVELPFSLEWERSPEGLILFKNLGEEAIPKGKVRILPLTSLVPEFLYLSSGIVLSNCFVLCGHRAPRPMEAQPDVELLY